MHATEHSNNVTAALQSSWRTISAVMTLVDDDDEDNTKVCNTCVDVKPLSMFRDFGSGYNGRTCIDCHRIHFKNASIICNECGVTKSLSMLRDFGYTFGHLCHDCYSKYWKDDTKMCNKRETYKPVNLFNDFGNGFYANICFACSKEI
jgi:hypothetical protein